MTFRVVCCDGGGIRAVIPATFLAYLETETKKSALDTFDFFCGTSGGGLVTLGLTHPARFSANDLASMFREEGATIFSNPAGKVKNLFDPKYDGSGLRKVLSAKFGESAPLTSALKPVCVTSFDLVSQEPVFLSSYSGKPWSGGASFFDAGCATSAGETFFPAHGRLLDGGNIANNPSIVALSQAVALGADIKDVKILSLGTGRYDPSLANLADGGELAWASNISTVCIDGVMERDARIAQRLLGDNYLRLQPSLTKDTAPMDKVDVKNLAVLTSIASQLYSDFGAQVKEFLDGE